MEDFQYSKGWLQKFKNRHNICNHVAHVEAASVGPIVVSQGRQQLQEEPKTYAPKDVDNLDETGLFYNLLSNSTLVG